METTGLGSPIASHVYFRWWKPQDQHGGRFNSLKSRPLICVIYIDISCWWVESGWVPILAGWSWLVEIPVPAGWNPYFTAGWSPILPLCYWWGYVSQPKTRRRWRTHSFLSSWRRCGVAQMALLAEELKNGWVSTRKLEVWVGKMGFKQQQLGTQQGHVQGEFLTTTTVLWLFLLLSSSVERWATLVRYG